MAAESRRSVAGILAESAAVYRNHFALFVALTAVIYVPYNVFLSTLRLEPSSSDLSSLVGILMIGLMAQSLASILLIWCIARIELGMEVSFVGALSFLSLGTMMRVFGTALLAGGAVLMGFLLLVLPGIVLLVWFAFVNQVVIVEDMAFIPVLRRSMDLAKGYGWRILYVLALILSINLLSSAVVGQVFGEAGGVIAQGIGLLIVPFGVIALTRMYLDVREKKEGFVLAELAGRFGGSG